MKQEIWIGIFECGVVGVEIFFDKYIIFNNLIAFKKLFYLLFSIFYLVHACMLDTDECLHASLVYL